MKRLALVCTLVLVVAASVLTGCSAGKSEAGIVSALADKSITIISGGKAVTYEVSDTMEVAKNGKTIKFADGVKKGQEIMFSASGKKITKIECLAGGQEGAGKVSFNMINTRVMSAESPVPPKANEGEYVSINEIGDEEDTNFGVYKGGVELGDLELIPGTLEVTYNNKPLKVIEDEKAYDNSVLNDEVKVIKDGSFVMLEFEKTPVEYYKDEFDKVLKVKYRKKTFEVTTTEISSLNLSDKVVATLNGELVPLTKALDSGSDFNTYSSASNEVILVEAFKKN